MAAPNVQVCSAWATADDLCDPCLSSYDDIDPTLLDRMFLIASDLLFKLSGRRYSGTCTASVRPCSQSVSEGLPRHSPSSFAFASYPSCGCNSPRKCGCPRPSEITLGVEPITSIEEVKVDGAVLDPSLYRIDDYKYLVRLRDPDGSFVSWPCCQDILLPDTEPDTFSVSFSYGTSPPESGVLAAAVLACELALQCGASIEGAECRLPKRVVSLTRQGVSVIVQDPTQALFNGRFGIPEIDQFLAVENPHRLRRSATAISPDFPRRIRRVDTGAATP